MMKDIKDDGDEESQIAEDSSRLFGWGHSVFAALELRFPPGQRYVPVPDHVLDLSLHRDAEEGEEVHDQDRPEDGNVEEFEEGTAESDHGRFGGGVPELELW